MMKKIFYTVFLALAVISMQAQVVREQNPPGSLRPAQKAAQNFQIDDSSQKNQTDRADWDLASAAKTLKISQESLEIALAHSSSNLKTAAKKLNVPLSELQTALGVSG